MAEPKKVKVILVHDVHLNHVITYMDWFRDSVKKTNELIKQNPKRLEEHREALDDVIKDFRKKRKLIIKAYENHCKEVINKAKKAKANQILTETNHADVYFLLRMGEATKGDSMWKRDTIHQLKKKLGIDDFASLEPLDVAMGSNALLHKTTKERKNLLKASTKREGWAHNIKYAYLSFMLSKKRLKSDKKMAESFIDYVEDEDGPFVVQMGAAHVKGFKKFVKKALPDIQIEEVAPPEKVRENVRDINILQARVENVYRNGKDVVRRLKRKAKKPVSKKKLKKRARDTP